MEHRVPPEAIAAHVAKARENARFCILCKYISRAYEVSGELREVMCGGVTVSVDAQRYHLGVCAVPGRGSTETIPARSGDAHG
jgi:hypothetical protein